MPSRRARSTTVLLLTGALTMTATAAGGDPVYVRPGAPGEPSRVLPIEEVVGEADYSYTEADLYFMQHMIPHHGQALTMSALAEDRADSEQVLTLARRIYLTQSAEIERMQRWLERRGEHVPEAQGGHGHEEMPGMLTEAELAALEAADGAAFDRLFLESMIPHHQGAITMVNRLEATPGGGLEPTVAELADQIEADQRAEIARMQALLAELPD